jgi:hypothetical protein
VTSSSNASRTFFSTTSDMKFPKAILWLLTLLALGNALALPAFDDIASSSQELFRRKGGGGGGGKGGGGSRGSGSSSSSSSSGSSGGSSSSRTSSSSAQGGTSKGGSGIRPSYGSGGRYYGGGAATPYQSHQRSPSGIAPYFLAGSALAFFPGLWLYGAYAYSYPHPYTYHNDSTNANETRPVQCLCANYAECGCDPNNDTSYINSVANNNTVSRVADVNGTSTLFINGTLANGTTAASSAAPGSLRMQGLLEMSGWWVVVAIAGYAAWLL